MATPFGLGSLGTCCGCGTPLPANIICDQWCAKCTAYHAKEGGTITDVNGTYPLNIFASVGYGTWYASTTASASAVTVTAGVCSSVTTKTIPIEYLIKCANAGTGLPEFRVQRQWYAQNCSGTWRVADATGSTVDYSNAVGVTPTCGSNLTWSGTLTAGGNTADPVGGTVSITIPKGPSGPATGGDDYLDFGGTGLGKCFVKCSPCNLITQGFCVQWTNGTLGNGSAMVYLPAHTIPGPVPDGKFSSSCVGIGVGSIKFEVECVSGSLDVRVLYDPSGGTCSSPTTYSIANGALSISSSTCTAGRHDDFSVIMSVSGALNATYGFTQFKLATNCNPPVTCNPCDIPKEDLVLSGTANIVTPGGSGLTSTMTYTASPDKWTSGCIKPGTVGAITGVYECDAGNAKLTVNLSTSTATCGVGVTSYSMTYGTANSNFFFGTWASITSQNWDGVTAPSISITGWTIDAAYVTSTSNAASSPNSLAITTSATNTHYFAMMSSTDGAGGDCQASGSVYMSGSGRDSIYALVLRGSSASLTTSGSYYSGYVRNVDFSGAGGMEFGIEKRVSGTQTIFGPTTTSYSNGGTDRIILTFTAVGTRLVLQAQRTSDNKWLDSSGTWVTGETYCRAVTDSSISGAGYAGQYIWQQSITTRPTYSDNYALYGVSDNHSCSPLLETFTVLPGNALYDNGWRSFTVTE